MTLVGTGPEAASKFLKPAAYSLPKNDKGRWQVWLRDDPLPVACRLHILIQCGDSVIDSMLSKNGLPSSGPGAELEAVAATSSWWPSLW